MMSGFARRSTLYALLALALVAGGCGSNKNPTGPATSELTQSEANDVAVQTCFALDQIGLDMEGAGSGIFMSPALRQGAMPLRTAWDTTVALGGLTAEISRDFYDAGGGLLHGYGLTAVRMNWSSHIWGMVETLRDTSSIQHRASFDFTGIQLADTALTLTGTCADTLLNRFHSLDSLVTHYGYWRTTLSAAGIAMRKLDGLPLNGTLTYVGKVDKLHSGVLGDAEKQLSVIVVITFNGTRFPDVVVNGDYHYRWDMEHGSMIPV